MGPHPVPRSVRVPIPNPRQNPDSRPTVLVLGVRGRLLLILSWRSVEYIVPHIRLPFPNLDHRRPRKLLNERLRLSSLRAVRSKSTSFFAEFFIFAGIARP